MQQAINLFFFDKSSNYLPDEDEMDDLSDLVKRRLKEPELEDDKKKLLDWLKTNMNKQSTSLQVIDSQIQNMIDKY